MTGNPDPEILIAGWLKTQLNIVTRADPHLPSNWPFTAPIALVQRGASAGQLLSLDDITLDIDVYAAKADHARAAASDIWAAMTLRLRLTTFPAGPIVTLCQALTAPMWAPDPKVYRRTAAYRVILHGYVT